MLAQQVAAFAVALPKHLRPRLSHHAAVHHRLPRQSSCPTTDCRTDHTPRLAPATAAERRPPCVKAGAWRQECHVAYFFPLSRQLGYPVPIAFCDNLSKNITTSFAK
eukprot:SAG11_NODE_637_length_8033_cov_4.585707_8_plen_107_part_00